MKNTDISSATTNVQKSSFKLYGLLKIIGTTLFPACFRYHKVKNVQENHLQPSQLLESIGTASCSFLKDQEMKKMSLN